MPKQTPRRELVEFVMDKAAGEPPAKRAAVYRALAEYIGDPDLNETLRSTAEALELAEKRCREFHFTFRRQEGGQ